MFIRIPPYLNNKYAVVSLVFFTYLLFFDRNNLISQYKIRNELKKLEEERTFFHEEIKKDNEKLKELITNPKTLEKFAREKYLMKKENEEIFVLVKE
jgi:cell division protein DivIC